MATTQYTAAPAGWGRGGIARLSHWLRNTVMFKRAARIWIPTTVTFYLLTLLLSTILVSVLRVSTRNFYFGVATTLLAHAAVYLLTRERIPAWATLFILALVVPLFPPEALTPIERGALYWGILAGLVSYTLTYGAHYFLTLSRSEGTAEPVDRRQKKRDRHLTDLFHLLNVTSLSQALRAVRKLLQERDRWQSGVDSAEAAGTAEVAQLHAKLKETQSQLKQLRKRSEEAKQPQQAQHREMASQLEQVQRTMQETLAAKDEAEQRAQSLETFQLKVAELTQQMNALRSEAEQHEARSQELQLCLAKAESEREEARAEYRRLADEFSQRQASTVRGEAALIKETQQLDQLKRHLSDLESRNQELTGKMRGLEEALAAAHVKEQELRNELQGLRPHVEASRQLVEARSQIAALERAKHRAVTELGCLRSQLREKNRELQRTSRQVVPAGPSSRTTVARQTELEAAQEKIASLEESVSFYQQTIEELTPEVDRLDRIISRYEAAYGPPPPPSAGP